MEKEAKYTVYNYSPHLPSPVKQYKDSRTCLLVYTVQIKSVAGHAFIHSAKTCIFII